MISATPYKGVQSTTDPYFSDVVLLMNGDALVDASSYAHTVASSPNVTLAGPSVNFPFGSMQFGGVAGNGVFFTSVTASEWDFGAGDFTFEVDYVLDPGGTSSYPGVFGTSTSFTTDGGLFLFAYHQSIGSDIVVAGDEIFPILDTPRTPIDSHLFQVAISRVAGIMYLFVNGRNYGQIASTDHFKTTTNFVIGNAQSVVQSYFVGNIARVRLTKGVGRYTQNYITTKNPWPTS